jgi:hypothetical protein
MVESCDVPQDWKLAGGGVTEPGAQPGYALGQLEPLEHTWPMQAWFFAPQLSHTLPNWPQKPDVAPLRHCPVASQQPAQLSGPQ